MSITSRINEMSSHIEQAYDELQGLGADLTNVNKNIENISMVLDDIYNDLPKVTGSGTSIILDGTRKGRLESTLKGNTSQSGTPTPTSPIPINVVSGDNEINVVGKNIWNENTQVFTNQARFDNPTKDSNNKWTFIANSSGYAYAQSSISLPAGTYIFSSVCTGGNTLLQKDGVTITSPFTITETSTITCRVFKSGASQGDVVTLEKVMLCKGSTATEYEPYTENTYNIDLPEGMELCSSQDGTIGDYFLHDKTTDKWYLYKIIYKKIFNETDTIEVTGTSSTRTLIAYNTGITLESYTGGSVVPNILCTHLISASQGATWVPGDISRRTQDPKSLFYILEAGLTTTTGLQWLVNNNVVTYTPMAEPIVTEITYQPLIDQLNLLEKAMSKDGQTNISQVNNDLPFIISASALKEWQENTSLNSTLSMVNPLSLGNTLNTQEIENDIQPIEVDNIEPLEEEENEES